ncbi:hypothetical protein E4K67_25775 [Desulfosporosinus fructosivorans]|uniref:Uncharacterized protein n=1 Tax=Desulfosporosinus fructosivorans TaxID=2018669 RepID=A0A4Z0QYP4_9FIRM|nr:hypothetical protein [Desulfosporosinus fructosivorans]TGE35399.1 hypothetical protein E4K67_25775 [Desulfosporosinus fructosivorans]
MKKIVFLAHDPGGYEALFTVVERMQEESVSLEFYCLGPAAKLNPSNAASESRVVQTIQSMLLEKKMSGLVTGTSWGNRLELKVMAACKEARIPTISILDYWSNYQARFKDDLGDFIYPDIYIVMDELAEQEARQEGVPSNILKVLGHPGLDKYILQRRKATSFGNKKKLLFLSQPLSALYGQELGYTEQQALEECLLAVQGNDDYSFSVRFHPKDDPNWKRSYAEISVDGALLDIMPEHDLIIGMNTIGLLHAVLMGIPALSYQPNLQKPDLCITNKLGFTRLIKSYQELEFLLNTPIGEDRKNICLPKSFIWLDGHSTDRVVGFIREVLLDEH